MCFFDGSVRNAPVTWEEYCCADHVAIRFPDGGSSLRALTGVDKSRFRDARLSVANFNGIPPFIKGTNLIATEMNLMKHTVLSELDMAPLPVPSDPVTVYMTWHRRSSGDPSHVWLRRRIERIAHEVQQSPI